MMDRLIKHRAALLRRYKKKKVLPKTQKGRGKRAQKPIRENPRRADPRRMEITKPDTRRESVGPADVTKGYKGKVKK